MYICDAQPHTIRRHRMGYSKLVWKCLRSCKGRSLSNSAPNRRGPRLPSLCLSSEGWEEAGMAIDRHECASVSLSFLSLTASSEGHSQSHVSMSCTSPGQRHVLNCASFGLPSASSVLDKIRITRAGPVPGPVRRDAGASCMEMYVHAAMLLKWTRRFRNPFQQASGATNGQPMAKLATQVLRCGLSERLAATRLHAAPCVAPGLCRQWLCCAPRTILHDQVSTWTCASRA